MAISGLSRVAAGSEIPIELFLLFLVSQASFAEFARVGVHIRNLLEARVIITSYNHHVRLLFSRAFLVGFSTTNFTRAQEPTLLWNHYTNRLYGAFLEDDSAHFHCSDHSPANRSPAFPSQPEAARCTETENCTCPSAHQRTGLAQHSEEFHQVSLRLIGEKSPFHIDGIVSLNACGC